ncbi:MAG: hypothetical protein RI897_3091 [Verrucomicrobiota bacterium]
MGGDAGFAGGIPGEAGFGEDVGEGFMADDVFAAAHGLDGDGGVEVFRGHDVDRIEVGLAVEHFAEVVIGAAADGSS